MMKEKEMMIWRIWNLLHLMQHVLHIHLSSDPRTALIGILGYVE